MTSGISGNSSTFGIENEYAPPKSRIFPFIFLTYTSVRSPSSTEIFWSEPAREISSVTERPGGVSRISRRNCTAPSTGCPSYWVITSFSFMPAFAAGLSGSMPSTMTPRTAESFKSLAFSAVPWAISTPSQPPSSVSFGGTPPPPLGGALQFGEPGFNLFLDVTNLCLHLFHAAVEIPTLFVGWRRCSVRGGLLGSGNLFLRLAERGLGDACNQQENTRASEARVCAMPHGFHPLSWITPRKAGNQMPHDEKCVVAATVRFPALDAWALQNQAYATIDGAH